MYGNYRKDKGSAGLILVVQDVSMLLNVHPAFSEGKKTFSMVVFFWFDEGPVRSLWLLKYIIFPLATELSLYAACAQYPGNNSGMCTDLYNVGHILVFLYLW